MDGLFLEHGPLEFRLDATKHWTLTSRPTSWHKAPAYVVYVDQPVGTGLSFTTSDTYPKNDEQVNIDFYYWLQQFLMLHSDVLLTPDKSQLKRPFYFSGESHAGHYIPSMMAYIQKQNQKNQKSSSSSNNSNDNGGGTLQQIQLTGAAIGNGWVDPYHQYATAAAAYGHGLIGRAQQHALDEKEKECQAKLTKGNYRDNVCFELLDDVVAQSYGKTSPYKVSQYDIRQKEDKHGQRNFPPQHKIVETYLGGFTLPEGTMATSYSYVLAAIHASQSRAAGQVYQECTDPPYNALAHQDGMGVTDDVRYLLESGIKLLFFNGIMDLICNHVGNEITLERLNWSHQKDYIMAPRYAWMSGGNNKVAGYMKEFKNLSYLKVLESGHMAPLDQPEICLDMMTTFMYGQSFQSSQQTLSRSLETNDPSCPICPQCPAPTTVQSSDDSSESNDDKSSSSAIVENDDVIKFIIAHSWLGAVGAVVVFLGFVFCMRKRPTTTAVDYSGLEMNVQYRDDMPSPDEEQMETMTRTTRRIT
jgi:carboxypeptidase D